jgi:hypothetical protein
MMRHNYAWVRANEGEAIECLLVDISKTGARLIFPTRAKFPTAFGLVVVPSGPVRPASLVWRNGQMAGIKFLPAET